MQLHHQRGGEGDPALLLLHGLGATGEVWNGLRDVVRERWPGQWVIPDLRGHGRSGYEPPYTFGQHAADVAALLDQAAPTLVVGHSMGGAVGLALASGWFGVQVVSVVGVGIKVAWTDDELARIRDFASRPARWFDSFQEAEARYLRVAGLDGLVDTDSSVARSGVLEVDGRFRLAADPRAAAIGPPDMRRLLAAAGGQVVLACGSDDRLVTVEQLRDLVPDPVELTGLGHNAHVQDPQRIWELVQAQR